MKKFRVKLYFLFLAIFIISFGIFFGAYYLLSTNYVAVQAGENFTYMADKVAVEFNLCVNREYASFCNDIDKIESADMTTEQLYNAALNIKDDF